MKKAAKWLLCINLLAWTLLAVQVLTVNMEQRVAQNMVPVQNGDVQAKGEDADAVKNTYIRNEVGVCHGISIPTVRFFYRS